MLKQSGNQELLGALSYQLVAIIASTEQTGLNKLSITKHKLYVCSHVVGLCGYLPVLCGVSDSSDELHSFGVVVDLRVESYIPLDKVS